MTEKIYGFPDSHKIPANADFVTFSNEDIGFTSNLVAGTNDVYSFALPFPASIDIDEEIPILHALEFLLQTDGGYYASTTLEGLVAHLAMLDREFSASWFGFLSDSDDEAMKAQFAGPIYFGRRHLAITAVASVEGTQRRGDSIVNAVYRPPFGIDQISPIYVQLTNQTKSITLATNAHTEANFSSYEKVAIREWFTTRRLTSAEKGARSEALRLMRLDS